MAVLGRDPFATITDKNTDHQKKKNLQKPHSTVIPISASSTASHIHDRSDEQREQEERDKQALLDSFAEPAVIKDDHSNVFQSSSKEDIAISRSAIENSVIESQNNSYEADILLKLSAFQKKTLKYSSLSSDSFGLDEKYLATVQKFLDFLCDDFCRVTVVGKENIPKNGRAIFVGNHAGFLPLDALLLLNIVRRHRGEPLKVRALFEDFFMNFPFLGTFLSRIGGIQGNFESAKKMLFNEMSVVNFPEGVLGISKPYSKRYQLQRFGRGGFIRLAYETKSPIVPVAIIGSEEAYPLLAKILLPKNIMNYFPFFPFTFTFPWFGIFGLLPLPVRWKIIFGQPLTQYQNHIDSTYTNIVQNVMDVKDVINGMIEQELH